MRTSPADTDHPAITWSSSIQTSQCAREHVDVRARLPVGVRLAAVGIAEREVHARHLLVLQQDADHVAETEVGAERELADAIAVGVGVAVVPEILLQVLALARAPTSAARRGFPARSGVVVEACRTWR